MLELLIAGLVLGAIGTVVGTGVNVGLGVAQNDSNVQSVKDTNSANLQAVRETNQANIEQANLAYQRSLPINQVSNLVNAGMSKPAALNSLSGGGTYNAPVLQTSTAQAPQRDFSGIMSAVERLGSIPTNVVQQQIMKEQLHALEVDTYNKEQQEKRAADLHEYDIWNKTYGKDATQKLDAASNLIMNKLLDSGKDINDFKSYESLVRGLGLQDSKEVRDLPSIARQQLFSSVKDKYAESREQREQENRNTAAEDAHIKVMDELKNSEFARTLSHQQYNKIVAETEEIYQRMNEFDKDSEAREYNRTLRINSDKLENLLKEIGISRAELMKSVVVDKNGNYITTEGASHYFKEMWRLFGAIFGIEYLGDLLKGIIAIAPK